MNISKVSFGSVNDDSLDIPSWVNKGHKNNTEQVYIPPFVYENQRANRSSGLERTPKNDQFKKTTGAVKSKKTHTGNSKKKSIIPIPIKAFAAGVATTLLVNAGAAGLTQTNNAGTVTIPYDNSVSISEIANTYDIDEEVIYSYNNITEETDLDELTELNIPSSYDYLQDEIDSLQEQLYAKNLSDEERAEIEERINNCKEKQEYQQNIATVYSDGKYVYFEINEIDENSPEEIYENFKYGINVEVFKDIFDIKDGVVKEYNDLSKVYRSGENEYDKGYYDYTGNTLHSGEVIKVPVKAIMTDDISFDY